MWIKNCKDLIPQPCYTKISQWYDNHVNIGTEENFIDDVLHLCWDALQPDYSRLLITSRSEFLIAVQSNNRVRAEKSINKWAKSTTEHLLDHSSFKNLFGDESPSDIPEEGMGICQERILSNFVQGCSSTLEPDKSQKMRAVMMIGLWSHASEFCSVLIMNCLIHSKTPHVDQKIPSNDIHRWRWLICFTKCVEASLHYSEHVLALRAPFIKELPDKSYTAQLKKVSHACLVEAVISGMVEFFAVLSYNPNPTFTPDSWLTTALSPATPDQDFIQFLTISYIIFAYESANRRKWTPLFTAEMSFVQIASTIIKHDVKCAFGSFKLFMQHYRENLDKLCAIGRKSPISRSDPGFKDQRDSIHNDQECEHSPPVSEHISKLKLLQSILVDKEYFDPLSLQSESEKVCHEHNLKNDDSTKGKGSRSNVQYIATLSVLVTHLIETLLERKELDPFEEKVNKAMLSSLKNQSSSNVDLQSIIEGLRTKILSFDRFCMEIISNGCHRNKSKEYLKLLTDAPKKNSDALKSTIENVTPTPTPAKQITSQTKSKGRKMGTPIKQNPTIKRQRKASPNKRTSPRKTKSGSA